MSTKDGKLARDDAVAGGGTGCLLRDPVTGNLVVNKEWLVKKLFTVNISYINSSYASNIGSAPIYDYPATQQSLADAAVASGTRTAIDTSRDFTTYDQLLRSDCSSYASQDGSSLFKANTYFNHRLYGGIFEITELNGDAVASDRICSLSSIRIVTYAGGYDKRVIIGTSGTEYPTGDDPKQWTGSVVNEVISAGVGDVNKRFLKFNRYFWITTMFENVYANDLNSWGAPAAAPPSTTNWSYPPYYNANPETIRFIIDSIA